MWGAIGASVELPIGLRVGLGHHLAEIVVNQSPIRRDVLLVSLFRLPCVHNV